MGFEQNNLQQQGVIFVVADVQCRNLLPACLDDELIVAVAIKRLSGARILSIRTVKSAGIKATDNSVLCEASAPVEALMLSVHAVSSAGIKATDNSVLCEVSVTVGASMMRLLSHDGCLLPW